MRKYFGIITLLAAFVFAASCDRTETPQEKAPIVIYDGPVDLVDQGFGMYYGDKNMNNVGVYYIVLSDAICNRDGYGTPYLDSEGDMLVLEFNSALQPEDAPVMIPEGEYVISATKGSTPSIDIDASYLKKLVGNTQYHYSLVSGSVNVMKTSSGDYDIITKDLKVERAGEVFDAQYSYSGPLKMDEWSKIAADIQGIDSDIINMPFTDIDAVYYGNLFGYGTGNYVINFSTDGFMADDTGLVPGIALVMNMFAELIPNGSDVVLLPEGTYTVYPSFNSNEFSMLYGLNMDGMPFGTYLAQVDKKGNQVIEFINKGTVEVTRKAGEETGYTDHYTFKYELFTPSRTISGTWAGPVDFLNAAEDSQRVILSTLDHDVECDLYRVERGYLSHIETLHTTSYDNPIDIAEAWQLWLEPRMWTEEEKKLPWDERIEAWNPNGDVMILEFVVPLDSNGDLAPETDKEYTYTIQPDLAMDTPLYNVSVSRMGRPYDDIFYEPNWGDYTYMTGTDARRGFTWDGGFRGNWYLHYIEGTWQNMDETAPAVKGTVKVKRTSEYSVVSGGREAQFDLVWDLYDDTDNSYNITGEWSGPITLRNGM